MPEDARRSGGGRRPPEDPPRGGRQVPVDPPDDYRPKRKRKRGGQSGLLIALVVILVGGVLFAGGKLGSILLNYYRDRSAYNNLAEQALTSMADPNVTTEPGATPDPNAVEEHHESELPFTVDWDLLRSVNSDVVAWIYCDGTQINYPVAQTIDNDYYLHRDFTTRAPNTAGTLFADFNCALGVNLSNFLIYGHNMKDGSMFASIERYVDQSYYNEHPIMYLLTPTQNYRVELIAGRIVESTLNNYPSYFASESEYSDYLNRITMTSFFSTNAFVSTNYQLISLSTCDYSSGFADPRFLLQGLLVPVE